METCAMIIGALETPIIRCEERESAKSRSEGRRTCTYKSDSQQRHPELKVRSQIPATNRREYLDT